MLTTPATPEVLAKGLEADGYQLGVSAYTWGYPLVHMERVIRDYTDVPSPKPATSYRAPLNTIGWAAELATPAAKDMPTANNDTFYMSAVVKLDTPYILSVPATGDRYYVVNIFNMWHELEHYIGRRTTGTKAGRYAIVPPGWSGQLPSDVKRLDVTTDKVWLWGRMRIAQGEPAAPVLDLQKQFRLEPLGASAGTPGSNALPPLPSIAGDDLGFLKHLAFALKENRIKLKVGTDTKGLKRAADGSITMPIQAEAPQGDAAANWLPAPKGDFYVILRLFQPSDEILNGTYQLPQVRKGQ